jgi:hypothetical protein
MGKPLLGSFIDFPGPGDCRGCNNLHLDLDLDLNRNRNRNLRPSTAACRGWPPGCLPGYS